MLNGFGGKHRDFLQELNKTCHYHSMPLCNDMIIQVLDDGHGGMQYYQCAGLLHIRKYRYNPLSVTLLESQKNMIIFVVLC